MAASTRAVEAASTAPARARERSPAPMAGSGVNPATRIRSGPVSGRANEPSPVPAATPGRTPGPGIRAMDGFENSGDRIHLRGRALCAPAAALTPAYTLAAFAYA